MFPILPGGGGEEDYGEDFEGEYEGDDDGAVAGPSGGGGGGGGGVESGGGGAGGATKGRHQVKSTVKGEPGTGGDRDPVAGPPFVMQAALPKQDDEKRFVLARQNSTKFHRLVLM